MCRWNGEARQQEEILISTPPTATCDRNKKRAKENEVQTNISRLKQTNANVHVSMISTRLFANQNRERGY
ncbi:hypothetical protein PVAP13_6NG232000 [Panicum virgatum]|uniref:Uncharacterized protein n=1 Tax=Panicum virgatum TaxID=38727 RepID=A0A8T0QZ50_PANVG|nr:hypothetical protein PVAP13_6NG232000 [Panicum virgatum]